MSTSQDLILENCLKNCIFDGWGTDLLENACKNAGLDKNYWKIDFSNGAVDVIDYFNSHANEKLASELRVNDLRTTDKIRTAIKYRFGMNQEYKKQIQSMLGLYALHPVHATKTLYQTVDAIWRIAGDTATDWNYYSKRLLLAGVYSSTLMYWLNDNSQNNEKTWQFLNKRLAEVGKFGKTVGQIKTSLRSILPQA